MAWRQQRRPRDRQGQVLKWFMKLLDGCSAEDIAILLDWNQHADKIRILRSDLSYSNAHAPWILQWLILRRHRKHQLLRKSIPDLSGLRDNVLQFCSKLRWRWILQDQEGDQTLPRFKVPSTPCGKHTCNELEAWISTFRARMMSSGLSFVSRARYSMRSWSNLSGLERMAMSILRNGPHAALPNDKNTAFTLVLKQDVPTLFGNSHFSQMVCSGRQSTLTYCSCHQSKICKSLHADR